MVGGVRGRGAFRRRARVLLHIEFNTPLETFWNSLHKRECTRQGDRLSVYTHVKAYCIDVKNVFKMFFITVLKNMYFYVFWQF